MMFKLPDMNALKKEDPEVYDAIVSEIARQNNSIELIASENFASPAVMEALFNVMTNKYAEGYPGKRYYGGCENVDVVENLAKERLKRLFDCDKHGYDVNVQPHSGSQANLAAYLALIETGDTILGMDLSSGGHLSHGLKINFSGRLFNVVGYKTDEKGMIDYKEIEKLAMQHKPKLIIAGASAYSRTIDFEKFAEIAKKVDAYLLADIAHIAGLIIAGLHPSPLPYADVVTSTTHKTLRGTRGGIIIFKEELKKKINSSVFPGTQGGPLMHVIAGKAVAFHEALKPEFVQYQKQVLKNAKAMADEFLKEGIDLVSGGTDNHLMLIDLRSLKLSGKEAEKMLEERGITCNKNGIPDDPQPPMITSGLRIGTPAVTTRGFKEEECKETAKLMIDILKKKGSDVKKKVDDLCKKFPLYELS